jgi:hypothetical protein
MHCCREIRIRGKYYTNCLLSHVHKTYAYIHSHLCPRITRTVHTVETESTPVEKSAFVASGHCNLLLRLYSDHILCQEWLSTANNNFAITVMQAACSSGMLTNCSMPAMPINRCLLPIPIPSCPTMLAAPCHNNCPAALEPHSKFAHCLLFAAPS